jgi:CubicO group peptidase (beta-lactamase class C family)
MQWSRATEEVAAIAAAWTRAGGPGGVVLLFDAEDIRAEACGGFAELEFSRPFTVDTAVRYASITKHFLASLVLRSGDAVGLDDPLGAHLPALHAALGAVTVGRALDMTGGLPDVMETAWLLGVPPSAALDRAALAGFVQRLDALNFPPGAEISYSNTGYRLVQSALARRGIDTAAALGETFFQPLGLLMRLAEDQSEVIPLLAPGYWHDGEGWRRAAYGLHYSASGGLAGNALDLVTWLQALMAGRPPAEGLLAALGARRHLASGTPTGYGLGLARYTLGDALLVGHAGSLPGYKTQFLLDAERQAGVVVLSNREDTDALGLALRVMAALHGEVPPEPAALPDGRFLAEAGPFWLDCARGEARFMGAAEPLVVGDQAAVSRTPYLPMRLRPDGDGIAGEIGLVARRFAPVAGDAALPPDWDGVWHCAAQNAAFAIADGVLVTGAGPLRTELVLAPLDRTRALAARGEGPWRIAACLERVGDTLQVASNRSRALRFVRAASLLTLPAVAPK